MTLIHRRGAARESTPLLRDYPSSSVERADSASPPAPYPGAPASLFTPHADHRHAPPSGGGVVAAQCSPLQYVCQLVQQLWLQLLGSVGASPSLAPLSSEQLQQLRALNLLQPFTKGDEAHETKLMALWSSSFPSLALDARESAMWKEMGWQGKDPSSDLRGNGGLSQLSVLLHFAQNDIAFPAVVTGERCRAAGVETLPVAITSINITNMLFEYLGFGMRPVPATDVARVAFTRVLMRAAGNSSSASSSSSSAASSSSSSSSSSSYSSSSSSPSSLSSTLSTGVLPGSATAAGAAATGAPFASAPADQQARALEAIARVHHVVYYRLEQEWITRRGSYMQFNTILGVVRVAFGEHLKALAARGPAALTLDALLAELTR